MKFSPPARPTPQISLKVTRPIIVDTREQTPWPFHLLTPDKGYHLSGGTVRRKLDTGDYSLEGLESFVGIERKSLSDLVGSLSHGRERFEREMERARDDIEHFFLVVEGSFKDIARWEYPSRMAPSSVVGSMLSLHFDYGVCLVTGHDRLMCTRLAARTMAIAERRWDERQA